MVAGADRMVDDLARQTDGGNDALFGIKGDPRVTVIGKVLRRCPWTSCRS